MFKKIIFSFLILNCALYANLSHSTEIIVSAASSLTNAFKEVAGLYEKENKDDKVLLNFGGSGALLQQISKGAPVDIFASADEETMDMAEKQGWVVHQNRHDFATNALVLIVPIDSKNNPRKLEELTTLDKIAVGHPSYVPAGKYTKNALDKKALWESLQQKMIHTQNVRQVLDYVSRKEVDAGFVYFTDAILMKDKVKIAFEVQLDTKIIYPLAQIKNSSNKDAAKKFINFVLSTKGQTILFKYGFKSL